MKQIKTIVVKMRDVDDLAEFDEKVNTAMAEGWALDKREALQVQSVGIVCILYAELERQAVEEKKLTQVTRCCENCKYYRISLQQAPCHSCENVNNIPDKWEAADA